MTHTESRSLANFNGPSGKALDKHFLYPLILNREDAWLCDLVPHSRMNRGQESIVNGRYNPIAAKHGLSKVQWTKASKKMIDESRKQEIVDQIVKSNASILITLGDEPLRQFASNFGSHKKLAEYGQDIRAYGQLRPITIDGIDLKLLPLVHPRQAAKLGSHSKECADLHARWIETHAQRVREAI